MMQNDPILQLFLQSNALLKGHFVLTSNKHSDTYFEKIKLIENPYYLEKIVNFLVEKIKESSLDFDYIVSPAYGAIAIGFLTALKTYKLFAFSQRENEKMTIRSGFSDISGKKAIIVEDIVTTGGSIIEVYNCCSALDVKVEGIFVLLDRSPSEILVDGIKVQSLSKVKANLFEPDDCPLCRANIPITKPGASNKKIQ
jgi:orotate phosphoribosyltransferase